MFMTRIPSRLTRRDRGDIDITTVLIIVLIVLLILFLANRI